METTQNVDFTVSGVARPNRKTPVKLPGPVWINGIEIDGQFSEYSLYEGSKLTTRENVSMELPAPIYASECYIEITSDQACRYRFDVTKAKEW
jgi:hypothetical protein